MRYIQETSAPVTMVCISSAMSQILYIFRTRDDHFGSRTAVAGSQHLQSISRTGERLRTVSYHRLHWSDIQNYFWFALPANVPYTGPILQWMTHQYFIILELWKIVCINIGFRIYGDRDTPPSYFLLPAFFALICLR